MTSSDPTPILLRPEALFDDSAGGVPVRLYGDGRPAPEGAEARWQEVAKFTPTPKKLALMNGPDGSLSSVAFGLGSGRAGEPCGPSELLIGHLAQALPGGLYRLDDEVAEPTLAALAFGLGAYRFHRYKSAAGLAPPRLAWPHGADRARVLNEIEAVWLARDLINTPANDMGPEDLEHAVRELAVSHGAHVDAITGDDLLTQNFPLVHAVGRASPRAPRVIDLTWGSPDAPKVTLVGKGIVFDTGGLDIKPSSAMLLMKKDMGGAAAAIALAHMIMGQRLPVRLRLVIPAAENAVSGNAFRPSDILRSRSGATVEIGNTDAEGRLVLADAMALADEEAPDSLLTFATLTGAARVALGPDLPAFFTSDDAFAARVGAAGLRVGDPVWRMPLWDGYDRNLDSEVADMNNVSESPFSGAIIAALFLRRFVRNAKRFAHVDLYGWRPAPRALGPKGGEPQSARAILEALRQEYGA